MIAAIAGNCMICLNETVNLNILCLTPSLVEQIPLYIYIYIYIYIERERERERDFAGKSMMLPKYS